MSQTGLPPSRPSSDWDDPWRRWEATASAPVDKPLSKAAVTSLVLGCLSLSIPGIIAGIIGVNATGRLDDRRGRGLAWAGIAVSTAWLLVAVGIVAWTVAGRAERGDDGTVQQAGTSTYLDLQKGDCLQDPRTDGSTTEVRSVDVTPCTDPHDAQVFALVQPTTPDFDSAAISAEVQQLCTTAAKSAITVSEQFDLLYFYPQQQAWDRGTRTSVCILSSPSRLTSSVVTP